ncbi:hypothetical protein LUZ63_000981 [Rhynchospora breviuscula]|uniref:BED-type domain-containing protein n=1 Tax=Rhynchospora breviuscula TaxID=2022672 RepID=A0A9Q0HWL7_9POAL|nr:hypothetical protein LUZ63_000981 [Rhynchospora breviuscula]
MSTPIEVEDENVNASIAIEESQSVHLEEEDGETVNEDIEEPGLSKAGRKRKSPVWKHFVEIEVQEKGKVVPKVECKHCKKRYKYVDGGPTSTLLLHVKSKCAALKKERGKTQGMLNFESQESTNFSLGISGPGGGYDHAKNREIMAKMIIAHELPFAFVEYTWFNILMKYNNHMFQKVSRQTIKKECMKVFESEREKMKKWFKDISKISLTSDCWTSNTSVGYMSLTAHYVDANWKLQKRIISFIDLAPPHSGEVISDGILDCLMKWGIQDKIGTITLDNASSNDRAAYLLKSNFEGRDKLHFGGLFFHVRCCAHILNLIVQDGLKVIKECLFKIREGVKYLRKSPSKLFKFGEIAIAHGVETKRSLCSDVQTRWNSTHRMLKSALHYKTVIHQYAMRDPNYEWEPKDVEWDEAGKICKFLEVFVEATNIFSGTTYPTANLFLVETYNVKKEICEAYRSSDEFLRKMSKPMFEKFEKYWGEVGVLMAVASIFDPRFKLASVQYTFRELYQEYEVVDRIKEVTDHLRALYEKYAKAVVNSLNSNAATSTSSMEETSTSSEALSAAQSRIFAFIKEMNGESRSKSDLEVYLEEPPFVPEGGRPFDVLVWWCQNCSKFPILSKLAKDVLCIPVTTVASESAFSAGGRVLDDYRSSLSKDMVELLVCGGDWLRAASKSTVLTLQQLAKEEEQLEVEIAMKNLSMS